MPMGYLRGPRKDLPRIVAASSSAQSARPLHSADSSTSATRALADYPFPRASRPPARRDLRRSQRRGRPRRAGGGCSFVVVYRGCVSTSLAIASAPSRCSLPKTAS
ncbi:hypothetical protein K523DRAFT_341315 [Schizophyllum commune Tattone D]|nr:hypothetical protein K523DRAFT_341315 [Schizophyllum commune Tattone D]